MSKAFAVGPEMFSSQTNRAGKKHWSELKKELKEVTHGN